MLAEIVLLRVRDHIPLEQGLRLISDKIIDYVLKVRDHIPLEQGLRRYHARQTFRPFQSETIFH